MTMVQTKFATILLVAAAATIAPVLAAPVPAERNTMALAAREPEMYRRALAFDFVGRSFDDSLDLEQRELADGIDLEERGFGDAVELDAREPFPFFDKFRHWLHKKKEEKQEKEDSGDGA